MRKLTLLAAMLLFSAMSYAQLTNGLVAYYPFTGNANDGSGNGQNGTVTGATLTTDRFGNNNSAYNFSAPSMHKIEAVAGPNMQLGSSDFTVVLWLRHTTAAQNMSYSYLGLTNSANDSALYVYQSTLSYQPPVGPPVNTYIPLNASLSNGNGSNIVVASCSTLQSTDANPYADGNWHMLVAKRQGTAFSVQIDSTVFSATAAAVYELPVSKISIGTDRGFNYTEGDLDDVMIYNRALSTVEIDSIYNLTASLTTAIVTTKSSFEVVLFPNPAQGAVQMTLPETGTYQVVVMDATGRQVHNVQYQNTNNVQLTTNTWAAGIYVVQVRDEKGAMVTKKLVKE